MCFSDAEKKVKNLEADCQSAIEDCQSAERLKRAAMSERDELSEENQTLMREKNNAQEEKRRMETRLTDLEEEKVFRYDFLVLKNLSFSVLLSR